MIGDFITKPLQGQLFRKLRSLVMNCPVDIPPEYMSPRDMSREDTGVCWDIARPDQPGSDVRAPAGPSDGPDVGAKPTEGPDGSHPGSTGPGGPGTEHVDTAPRLRKHHGGTDTALLLPHGRLKISSQGLPAGHSKGWTVPPSTYGGGLKVSGRTDPSGRSNTATALWEQLQRHGRRLGSLSSLA